MQLKKRLAEIHALVAAAPTLDPAKGFEPDDQRPTGVYKARTMTARRTRKETVPIVLYPATPEHPAQTQLVQRDVEVGTITTQEWSGAMSVVDKADMLERCEDVQRAVEKALARANDIVVEKIEIGRKLLDYVFGVAAKERV